MLKNIVIKYRKIIIITIGSMLILLSISLLFYDKVEYIKEELFSDIALKKYNEETRKNPTSSIDNEIVEVDTEYLDEETGNDEPVSPPVSNKKFIGFLEIDKISLRYGLVSKDSYYNNVNRNIEILDLSTFPDVNKGNLILAAHSGSSKISYFKYLYKLSIGNRVKVYYKDYIYNYKIVNIYKVPKTGSLDIYRDLEKTCLTMITCTRNSRSEQTVYIAELDFASLNKEGNND